MIEIPLGRGQFACIDECDADVTQYVWKCQWSEANHSWYAYTNDESCGYKWLHHLILERILCRALTDEERCDHIHHITLDNRRSELRVCTHSQNSMNRRTPSHNTSGYKGVSWHKQNAKWQARIYKDKKRFTIGYFDDVLDAARAYNNKARLLYGDFALLNEVE